MITKQRLFLLIPLFSFLGLSQDSFSLHGFDRLYNPVNGVTIDLVHDAHISNRVLTDEQWSSSDPEFIQIFLEPSERSFIEALKTINNQVYRDVDLIWEHSESSLGYDQFIAHSGRLVRDRFKNIHYIDGNRWRREFKKLLLLPPFERRRGTSFSSFEQPYQMPDIRLAAITENSGETAQRVFESLSTEITSRLKERLSLDISQDRIFTHHDYIGEITEVALLTDLEMLSRILSSPKKHLIVYAGGWHTSGLKDLLTRRFNCRLIETVRATDPLFLSKFGRLSSPLERQE